MDLALQKAYLFRDVYKRQAYEYLMTMYASNAGKSGGEFFTPADVSELLTRLGTVGKKEINKVYDPACGSGSLLLKAEKVLGRDAVRNGFFGQEINITTYNPVSYTHLPSERKRALRKGTAQHRKGDMPAGSQRG